MVFSHDGNGGFFFQGHILPLTHKYRQWPWGGSMATIWGHVGYDDIVVCPD